jgi:hypothetical protein
LEKMGAYIITDIKQTFRKHGNNNDNEKYKYGWNDTRFYVC